MNHDESSSWSVLSGAASASNAVLDGSSRAARKRTSNRVTTGGLVNVPLRMPLGPKRDPTGKRSPRGAGFGAPDGAGGVSELRLRFQVRPGRPGDRVAIGRARRQLPLLRVLMPPLSGFWRMDQVRMDGTDMVMSTAATVFR